MTKTGKTILQESELYELRARVVELDAELSALRRDHDALTALVDRIVVLLKTEHAEDSVLLAQVEQAAIDAITP
ncbi:MAG TPA: hypothetical protein VK923_10825 [Euzebyales bacterium]|nr:hypothetical protein [Euzebyales bacterium]